MAERDARGGRSSAGATPTLARLVLAGAIGAVQVLSLARLVATHLGSEPEIGDAHVAGALLAGAIAALVPARRIRLRGLIALAIVPLLLALAMGALAAIAAALVPEGGGTGSLLVRGGLALAVGVLVGAPAGFAVRSLAQDEPARSFLAALAGFAGGVHAAEGLVAVVAASAGALALAVNVSRDDDGPFYRPPPSSPEMPSPSITPPEEPKATEPAPAGAALAVVAPVAPVAAEPAPAAPVAPPAPAPEAAPAPAPTLVEPAPAPAVAAAPAETPPTPTASADAPAAPPKEPVPEPTPVASAPPASAPAAAAPRPDSGSDIAPILDNRPDPEDSVFTPATLRRARKASRRGDLAWDRERPVERPPAVALAAVAIAPLLAGSPVIANVLETRGLVEAAPSLLEMGAAALALGAWLGPLRAGPLGMPGRISRWTWAAVLVVVGLLAAATLLAPSLLGQDAVPMGVAFSLAAFHAGIVLRVALEVSPRGGVMGVALAALLAIPLGGAWRAAISAAWSPADRTWLALGPSAPERATVRELVAKEPPAYALPSFTVGRSGLVAVVDSRGGNARELRRNGRLLGAVAIAKGPSQADVLTPVVAVALVETFGKAGGHVACLGLGDGIAAGALGRVAGLGDLFVVEADRSLLAIKDDPGDLFFGAWKHKLLRLVSEDARFFLLRSQAPFDAIVDLEGSLASFEALSVAKERLAPGAALVRVVRAGPSYRDEARTFAEAFPDALAFRAPRAEDATILLGGVARLDSSRLAALSDPSNGLGPVFGIVRFPPRDLLGTFAAGREGLLRARTPWELAPSNEDALAFARAQGALDAEALADLATKAGKLGNLRVARALLEAARSIARGDTVELVRAEGDVLYLEGQEDAAVARWNRALALDPQALSPRVSLATRHLRRKDPQAARSLLEDALTGDAARDRAARYLLGRVAAVEQDYPKAVEHFEAAAGFEDADVQAEICRQLQKEAESMGAGTPRPTAPIVKDAKRLLREARLLLEDASQKERKLGGKTPTDEQKAILRTLREDARARLELARRDEPDNVAIFLELGRARASLGDPTGAKEAFEAAARLDPNEPRALYGLGDAYRDLGEKEAALDAYRRGLSRGTISSASARVYLACADLLVELKRPEEAAHVLEDAERLAPGHPIVTVNLASIYATLGRNKDAVRAYRRYLDLVGEGGDPELRKRVLAAIERLGG